MLGVSCRDRGVWGDGDPNSISAMFPNVPIQPRSDDQDCVLAGVSGITVYGVVVVVSGVR